MRKRFWVAFSWTLFNITLAIWWLIYGLRHTSAGAQKVMLISEGLILVLSLLLGGVALLYYMSKEQKRALEVRAFFASFSHELKTSIASLRLQVESLAEDFKDVSSPLMERLVQDSVRLEIQLENSLSLSQLQSSRFHFEEVRIDKIISSFEHHWPEVQFDIEPGLKVWADVRATETILRNLVQNAVLHGHAKEISVRKKLMNGKVQITVSDQGKGFQGNREQLGKLFFRHNSGSGSGVGLHLIQSLIAKLGGEVQYPKTQSGFEVVFTLPGVP